MAALQHLPGLADQRPLALPRAQRRALLDPIFGPLGGAAEGPEARRIGPELDRIVLPQSGGDHATVEIDNAIELEPFEADLPFACRGRKGQDRAHQARPEVLAAPRPLADFASLAWRSASSSAMRPRICSTSHWRSSSFCVAGS